MHPWRSFNLTIGFRTHSARLSELLRCYYPDLTHFRLFLKVNLHANHLETHLKFAYEDNPCSTEWHQMHGFQLQHNHGRLNFFFSSFIHELKLSLHLNQNAFIQKKCIIVQMFRDGAPPHVHAVIPDVSAMPMYY